MGGKAADPNKAARQMQREKMARLDAIELPELEEYILQNPELVGLLEAEQLDPSALEEISTDPRLKEQQMQALMSMQERADQGLTAQDKMAMEELMGQVGAQEKSQRASIESEMARRGMGDSGASLMAKLQGSQGGANSARQKAMQMAAQGQQQRMSALQNVGQMSGQMEGQDWQRQSQQASAKDAIAKANAMNRQNVNAMNLSARQQHENQRAGIANQQAQVANQIAQQNLQNQMAKAGSQNSISAGPMAPQQPSGLQQLATVGGGIAGAFYGGPTGAAAGAQAGSAVGGMFEDGGIAHKNAMAENKAHDKFKKDYMKRVREELAPQKKAREEVTGLQDGGVVHAQDGYDGTLGGMVHDFSNKDGFLGIGKNDLESNLRKGNAITEGVNTDRQINDYGDYQVENKNKELLGNTSDDVMVKGNEGMSDKDMMAGIGAAGKIAGLLNPKQEAPAEFKDTFKLQQAENIMKPIQAQEFGNAFQGTQFEDGGLTPVQELARMKNPAYACGGVHSGTKRAEDGDIMFDSQGDGAVVGGDSFERDRVDARLNSGEAVLNVAQQQRLMDILRGEESVDSLGDEDIVEGVPSEYQEELTEEIDNGGDNRVAGLKRLLSALGEE